jgi:RNA polymerase sigma-70 factor (ECF subfamily)
MCGEAWLAEELAQDAFVRAWEKLDTFRGDSAFFSWLYRLTVNVVLSDRRSRMRRVTKIAEARDLHQRQGGRVAQTPETRVDLEAALAMLPDGARQAFVLHDVEGYKHHEISEMTGIAAGTSKAQLHRARKLLREQLR